MDEGEREMIRCNVWLNRDQCELSIGHKRKHEVFRLGVKTLFDDNNDHASIEMRSEIMLDSPETDLKTRLTRFIHDTAGDRFTKDFVRDGVTAIIESDNALADDAHFGAAAKMNEMRALMNARFQES